MKEAEAKRLFCQYTDGRGVIDRLYGPANAPKRAAILSVLAGRKVAKSRAAWHEFAAAIYALYRIEGGCIAEKDSRLRDAVIANLNPTVKP